MKKKNPGSAARVKQRDRQEAEETLRAIRDGAVDAFVVQEADGHHVYTLEGSDLPYSALVERMQQGAAMLNDRGELIYCSPSLAQLLGVSREAVIGRALQDLVDSIDQSTCQKLLSEADSGSSEGEMSLRRADGNLVSAHFSFRLLSRHKSATGLLITDLTEQKQQEKFTLRLQRMQDEERRRIARGLHDSVGQLLVALGLNIARIGKEAHKLSPEAAKLIRDDAAMIDQINNEIRTISHLLHPPLLDEVGLPSALRWYIDGFAERSNIQTSLDIPKKLDRLPQEMEIAIFRSVQECLTNIHRHSGSSECTVKVIRDDHSLRVEVMDRGRGIAKDKLPMLTSLGGVGLRGMKERLRQLGGRLDIHSNKSGTCVIATLPLPRDGSFSVGVA
jgi:PAS domain S-box-containing protein